MIIGLTGGSGCGTTSVGKILSAEGWGFIDCDAVYHKMLNTDAALKAELAECFGEAILTQDGLVDRRALGRIVFASEKALADLNRITHARIAEKVISLIEDIVPLFEKRDPEKPLCVAFGCTGGRHRSVSFARRVCDALTEKGYICTLTHRELSERDL